MTVPGTPTPPPVPAPERARELWPSIGRLLLDHPVVIDRPLGSRHPRHDWIVYPLDYGYLEGTSAVDGAGVDVFLGSGDRRALTAAAVTFDPYKHDVEVKLLAGCTPAEVATVADFWGRTEMAHAFVWPDPGAASGEHPPAAGP